MNLPTKIQFPNNLTRNISRNLLRKKQRKALTLLELLAAIAIIGIIVTVAITTYFSSVEETKRNACYVIKGEIAVQAQLWFRNKTNWPANDLSDIGSAPDYFPAGLPTCPVDGSSYTIDAVSHEVILHVH